ncbi:MAG: M1 family metallopeptidase [Chitinophagaceae bacterium]
MEKAKSECVFIIFTTIVFIQFSVAAQSGTVPLVPTKADTLNGSITPERKWWDVKRYDLAFQLDPGSQRIVGTNQITYQVVGKRLSLMQIDLVQPVNIDSIYQSGKKLAFYRTGNFYYVSIPSKKQKDSLLIYFSGIPKSSVNPPWDGGLVWSKDSLGRPWYAVACQYLGASVWFPCKNALYDEPDNGASIAIRVPESLVAVSNGKLLQQIRHPDKTVTYQWGVVNPINHYDICFYIGNYERIHRAYQGEKGVLSMDFWVLDYNTAKAKAHLIPEALQAMQSLEYWFGPYPFYEDGSKMVDAPFIGMEHQSAIAYGNNYTKGTYKGKDNSGTGWGKKTDRLVVHELAHEWFGNNITASDIADRWLQEGFAGLAEQLVLEDLCGKQAGLEFLTGRLRHLENQQPVISRYGINEDGGSDGYLKGWGLIHLIRQMMGNDSSFRSMLRGLNQTFYHQTISSAQLENFIAAKAGIPLQVVFDQYLRSPAIPVLEYEATGDSFHYRFKNCHENFSLPVKTNWTGGVVIHPTVGWQTTTISTTDLNRPLQVNCNLIETEEVKR